MASSLCAPRELLQPRPLQDNFINAGCLSELMVIKPFSPLYQHSYSPLPYQYTSPGIIEENLSKTQRRVGDLFLYSHHVEHVDETHKEKIDAGHHWC